MYSVKPTWNDGSVFDKVWYSCEEENERQHVPNLFSDYFLNRCGIQLVSNGDGNYVEAIFKSKEHYVLFLLEWS